MMKLLNKIKVFRDLKSFVKSTLKKKMHKQKKLKKIRELIENDTLLIHLNEEKRNHWVERCNMVLSSPDNSKITRIKEAGSIVKGTLIMHNGIKIDPLSYYDYPMLNILVKNKGVHEPQEEYVFQEVLKTIPPNATMVELGSYWSFYSMWFYSKIKNANCYMFEPDMRSLNYGIKNFELNKFKGKFENAFIGDRDYYNENNVKVLCIDKIMKTYDLQFCHILHSDIQGAEMDMLKGSTQTIKEQKIGYVFISTHTNKLHNECVTFLKNHDFSLLAESDLDQTYAWDGLIVAKSNSYEGIEKINISNRIR